MLNLKFFSSDVVRCYIVYSWLKRIGGLYLCIIRNVLVVSHNNLSIFFREDTMFIYFVSSLFKIRFRKIDRNLCKLQILTGEISVNISETFTLPVKQVNDKEHLSTHLHNQQVDNKWHIYTGHSLAIFILNWNPFILLFGSISFLFISSQFLLFS